MPTRTGVPSCSASFPWASDAMLARLTPDHVQALEFVRDGQIAWRRETGPFGGFVRADGSSIPPSSQLVALYELRRADLIRVRRDAGRVTVTAAGLTRLTAKLGVSRR